VIYHGATASLAAGLICIANILYWRWLEEEKLASQFGEDYTGTERARGFNR